MKTPILETERLILRPVTMEDAPAIQKYFDNWNIIKNLLKVVPWPYPTDGVKQFIESQTPYIEKGTAHLWGLIPKAGPDEVIGILEFRFHNDKDDNRGFWLGEPFWGRGYMSEAVATAQDFIFFDLGKDRVVTKNMVGNIASRRVKEKTGAVFLGTDFGEYHEGRCEQEVWGEVTRENWTAFRALNPEKRGRCGGSSHRA